MRALAKGLLVVAIVSVGTPVHAQLVDGPLGSTGGVFGGHRAVNPNRNAQTFEMNIDLGGGYDREPNAIPIGLFGGGSDSGWPVGQGMLSTSYRVGHLRRSFSALARGSVNYFGNTHIPLLGGGAILNGVTTFGRLGLNRLEVNVNASYEPSAAFGAISPAPPVGQAPPLSIAPEFGVTEQRWFNMNGSTVYRHHWSARHQTDLLIGAGQVQPVADAGLNSDWQNATISQRWATRSGFDLQGSYRFDQSRQMDETASLPDGQPVVESGPTRYQTATIGVHLGRRLSAARRLSVSLSGGVTQLLSAGSASGEEFHPAVSLSFEFIPARMWALSMMASQQVTVMAGVSASPVDNKNFALTLNGTVLRRLHLAVTGNYMKGTTLAGTAMSHTAATGGNLGLQYGFKRSFGVYATYSYYHHRLENGLPTAAGIPPLYDRQSARVGFTLWLPLYGTF